MGQTHDENPAFASKLAALRQRIDHLYRKVGADSTQPAAERPGRSELPSPMSDVMLPDLPELPGRDVLQDIPAGVVRLNAEYRLVLANTTARRYFAALTTATIGERIPALGETPIEELVTPHAVGLPHEIVLAGPPRQVFTIRTRTLPAADIGGWILLIQDVTAERYMQRQQAQRERLAAMEQLVVGMASEFSTLLSCIIGYAELLQTQVHYSKVLQDDLSTVAMWANRGVQMARHLLDFSGTSVTRMRSCDLGLLLKTLVPPLERSLPPSIRVVLDIVPGAYRIHADVALIRQLLTHLTVNARDAMPDGGVLSFCLLHLTLRPDDPRPCPHMPDGEWVTLMVLDTGRGMPPQVQEHLFDPFFTTQTGTRAGLGLSQVHGVVKQHGGYMTVMSLPEEGTVFTLYFPSQTASENASWDDAAEAVPRGQGETLLLVDPDSLRREALRLTLRYLHYRVLTAANRQGAITTCNDDAIALVLIALAPTARDGLAWVRVLRQRHPKVKVMALLEEWDWTARHDLLVQGVSTCLRQPPDLPLLMQAIRQTLATCD